MTVSEMVDELRATRPRAGEALRLQVLTVASRPPAATPSRLGGLRGRRRLALLVPATVGLSLAAAIAIGVTQPSPVAREAGEAVSTTGGPDLDRQGPAADSAQLNASTDPVPNVSAAQEKAPPGTAVGRAQRYIANLTLAVEDTDALSEATQRSLTIARDLGGFVAGVRYATGEGGAASITLRVPAARSGDAVTRLSALGTIIAQNVQIDDLQESLDGLDSALRRLRAQLATVSRQLEGALTSAERARLQERRAQVQAELRDLRASRTATAAEARLATIQLELRTEEDSGGAAAPGSRLDRALDKALAVLVWEAVVALAIAVAVLPLGLVGVALWATRRGLRRRDDDRLLGAS